MGKSYIGVNGTAEEILRMHTGVGGESKRVLKAYVGVNGTARQVFEYRRLLVSIPAMTSASEPSGTVTSSSTYSGHNVWDAFDKDDSTRWESKVYGDDSKRWVKYDFGFEIQPVSIYVKNYTSHTAYAFKIEASKDNSAWTVLVDQSSKKAVVDETYTIETNETYRYFRYRCTNGSGTYRAGVWEMNVWGYKKENV